MASSSVGKPPDDFAVIAFYNLTWQKSRLTGKRIGKHKATLREDLLAGFQQHHVDVMLLSECGVVEEGMGDEFRDLLQEICGPEFSVTCQSHYACIVRTSTIDITKEPCLTEPLCPLPNHEFRRSQYLQITLKSPTAYKPVEVYNLHSPSSFNRPLTPGVREQILRWISVNTAPRALVGGDLNTSVFSLENKLGKKWRYYFQLNHKHGDLSCGKGIVAESMPCLIDSTSKDHTMCIVRVMFDKLKPEKGCNPYLPNSVPEVSFVRNPIPQIPWDDMSDSEIEKGHALAVDHLELIPYDEDMFAVRAQQRESTCYADSMLSAFDQTQDPCGDECEKLLTRLEARLWRPVYEMSSGETGRIKYTPERPADARLRLDRLIKKAIQVRKKYHALLYEQWYMYDYDFERSLTDEEMRHVHNLWMNDVKAWMSDDCYRQYADLLKSADDRKSQCGSKCKKQKGRGQGPRQQAQQLKKQRFNKVLSDLGANKNFVLAFVQHPSIWRPEGVHHIIRVLGNDNAPR